jgi:hypothetical protein
VDKFLAGKTLKFHSWVAGGKAGTQDSKNATDPTKAITNAAAGHGRPHPPDEAGRAGMTDLSAVGEL